MIGAGAVYEKNLPSSPYVIDAAKFAALTTRFRKTYPALAWPGFGARLPQNIDRYGIVGSLHVFFEGTLTGDGAGLCTPTSAWPWRLLEEVRVSANGISSLIDVDGLDLRALARVRRGRSLADESVFAMPTTNGGTATVRLHWEVPLALDEISLVGAVLAQTEDNTLTITLRTGESADLFSAHACTLTGNFYILASAYEIPEITSNGKTTLVIPDLRQLHGLFMRDDALVGTGLQVTELTKTGGLLLRCLQRIDNAPPNFGNVDWLDDALVSHKFRFNSKEIPYDFEPAWVARFLNEGDYSQPTLPAADAVTAVTPAAYLVDDWVNIVAMRDVVNMAAISQPELLNTITTGYGINANAKIHTVQEAMVTG